MANPYDLNIMEIQFCDLGLPQDSELEVWEKTKCLVRNNGLFWEMKSKPSSKNLQNIAKLDTALESQQVATLFCGPWKAWE